MTVLEFDLYSGEPVALIIGAQNLSVATHPKNPDITIIAWGDGDNNDWYVQGKYVDVVAYIRNRLQGN